MYVKLQVMDNAPSSPAILEGVTVLEIGSRVGASICGSLLSQLGAAVVFVEDALDPYPDSKGRFRAQMAAGKLSFVPGVADHGLLARLALRCDVVLLSSDRPAAFGPVQCAPGAVCCDVTAFGSSGPLQGQGWSDVQVQAISGVLDSTGHADGPPVPIGIPLVETVAGFYAFGAVLAALRVRRMQSVGQPIEIALYDVAFSMMTSFLPVALAGGTGGGGRVGNRQTMVAPWNVFRASDGWILLCAGSDEQWRRICEVVERPDLARAAGFATVPDRLANVAAVDAVVARGVGTRTVADCTGRFAAAVIPCGPIVPLAGCPNESNLTFRGMLLRRYDPVSNGEIHVPGSPFRMDATPGRPPDRIPTPDADRQAVVALAQREARPTGVATESGLQPSLHGVRVIELGHYTTAPLAARHLANLGADVIKVEPPDGEPVRHWPPLLNGQGMFFTFQNADKRSVVIDLRSAGGLAALRKLLTDADVLVENLKPGALAKFGLTPAALREINPRLVYCSVTGFGHASLYAGRPAFDAVIQAACGLMDVVVTEDVPLKTGPSSADIMGAVACFGAIVAALEFRDRSGLGQHVDISMQDVGAWATQAAWNRGTDTPATATVRACHDGFLCIEAGTDVVPDESLVSLTQTQAIAEFAKRGLRAVPVTTIPDVVAAEQTLARRLWFDTEVDGATYKLLASPLRLGRTSATVRRPGPSLGRDTAAVLGAPDRS